jgi:hypothetical protein
LLGYVFGQFVNGSGGGRKFTALNKCEKRASKESPLDVELELEGA